MTLRNYQKQTIEKMVWARSLAGNDLVSLPTGSGKSLIISELTKRLNEPILILVPSKELLEQDLEKIKHWTEDVDIYSASMNQKTVGHITLATIQSAYKNPELFTRFKVVIIDEADLINPKNLAGMYNKLFKNMGNPKIYGLTATPFRMDHFYRSWGNNFWEKETVHTVKVLTRYKERFWSRMLCVIHTQDLVNEGYLCQLNYQQLNLLDQSKLRLNKSKSDFDMEDFEVKFGAFIENTAKLISKIPDSTLVFCATVSQANELSKLVEGSVVVTGETSKKEREYAVQAFKRGQIRVVINVGVLLVGFDHPGLKNIIIARPTRSLRLHMQLLGRGMRIAEGKKTCYIWDLVGNVEFLGKAETLRIEKLEEKWNITTETFPQGMHNIELYSYQLKPKFIEPYKEQSTYA